MSRPNSLRFTPYAWAKLYYMMELAGKYEIAFMCESDPDDKLLVVDLHMILQENQTGHVEFDDEALSAYMEDMAVNHAVQPCDCMRIWLHTHPTFPSNPSGTDLKTFDEKFGDCSWAVMCIITGDKGPHLARLKVNGDFAMEQDIPVRVDWTAQFTASSQDEWDDEFLSAFRKKEYQHKGSSTGTLAVTSTGNPGLPENRPPYVMGGQVYEKDIDGVSVRGRWATVYTLDGVDYYPNQPGYDLARTTKDVKSRISFEPLTESTIANAKPTSDEQRAAGPCPITLSSNAPAPSRVAASSPGPKQPDDKSAWQPPQAVVGRKRNRRRMRGLGSKLRTDAGVDGSPAFPPG